MPEVVEGFVSLIGGMMQDLDPVLLAKTQYAKGVNVTSRKGLIKTRPNFIEIPIVGMPTGKFQGAAVYHLEDADRIVFAVAGHIWGINLSTMTIIDYSIQCGNLSATVDRMYFCQPDKYFVVQDGVTCPLVLDTETARLADQANSEVPTGTVMAYGHGRLFIVISKLNGVDVGRRFFVAGDIIYPTATARVLKFTETDYLSGGGAFSLPNELGFIESMDFIRNAQSGSGLGPLIVFAQKGCSAFNVNASRSTWQDIDISQVLFMGRQVGTFATQGVVPVNSDLLYRSRDGIRTMGYSSAATSGELGVLANNPISTEVEDELAYDTDADMSMVSSAVFDNRVYITTRPEATARGRYFKGLVVADASPVAEGGRSAGVIWDGIWTGLRFLSVLVANYSGQEALYSLAEGAGGLCRLFYLPDGSEYTDGGTSRPVARVYTRSYGFEGGNVGSIWKRFKWAEVSFSDIKGQMDANVYFRPDGYPLWIPCTSGVCEATMTAGGFPQVRRRIRFTPVDGYADNSTGQNPVFGLDFQFCIEITGHARLDKVRFIADDFRLDVNLGCLMSPIAVKLVASSSTGVELDDFDYEVTP